MKRSWPLQSRSPVIMSLSTPAYLDLTNDIRGGSSERTAGPRRYDSSLQEDARTQGSCRIKRPREIACFSYDNNRVFHADASSLKYYYNPKLGSSLLEGYDTFEKFNESADEHLDSLLKSLMLLEQKQGARIAELEGGIVTWRGMMTKILTAPYEHEGYV